MSEKMNYSEKLKDPRWQKIRLQVLERDNWLCQRCGDGSTTLHIHHFCYPKSRNPWDSSLDDLTTLCSECHFVEEDFKKEGFDLMHIIKRDALLIAFAFFPSRRAELAFLYLRQKGSDPKCLIAIGKKMTAEIVSLFSKMPTSPCDACGSDMRLSDDRLIYSCPLCTYSVDSVTLKP